MEKKLNYFVLFILIIVIFGMISLMLLDYNYKKLNDNICGIHKYFLFQSSEKNYIYTKSNINNSPNIFNVNGTLIKMNDFSSELVESLEIYYNFMFSENIHKEINTLNESLSSMIDRKSLEGIPDNFKELISDLSTNYFLKEELKINSVTKNEYYKNLMENTDLFPEDYRNFLNLIININLETLLNNYILPLEEFYNNLELDNLKNISEKKIEEIAKKILVFKLFNEARINSSDSFQYTYESLNSSTLESYSQKLDSILRTKNLDDFLLFFDKSYKDIMSLNTDTFENLRNILLELKIKYPEFFEKNIDIYLKKQNGEFYGFNTMKLKITNSDGSPMINGKVTVQNENNDNIESKNTNKEGEVIFLINAYEKYEIKIYGNKNIVLYKENVKISNENKNIDKSIEIKGFFSFTVYVRTADGIKLSESDIALYNPEQTISEVITTDSEGIVKFVNLPKGKYFYEVYYKSRNPFKWGSIELEKNKTLFIIF